MDLEAAVPQAKKMRTEAAERQQEPEEILGTASPPAGGAAHSEPTPHGQEPPAVAGGEEGDGVDRISSLPDAVLGEIISLLPTKDGARTQSLASQWRHLWLSAPLNLECSGLPYDEEAQVRIISRILAAHPGPGRRLWVPNQHLQHRAPRFDDWLLSPALDNLQELELDKRKLLLPPFLNCCRHEWSKITKKVNSDNNLKTEGVSSWYDWGPPVSLPASAFRFSATLRVVTISQCNLLDQPTETLLFPQLRQLAFDSVTISDVSLHSMIARCPVLECLLFEGSINFECLQINSPSLTSLALRASTNNWKRVNVVIEDAPLLERLLQLEPLNGLHVSVISAPKLETLGCFSDLGFSSKLVFATTVIQDLRADNITTVVHSVKTLTISIHNLSIDLVIKLMRCFPCMEKLYIQSRVSGDTNYWRRKYRIFLRSFDIRLKTVVLKNYPGTNSQVNFATFFVFNAKRLELMRFEVGKKIDDEIYIAEQRRMLQLEKRASGRARFYFTTGHGCQQSYSLTHVRHVRDLSTTDPFE
ncbi:hypothetical protein EJB05_45414, partial [Eragrostis curvula]